MEDLIDDRILVQIPPAGDRTHARGVDPAVREDEAIVQVHAHDLTENQVSIGARAGGIRQFERLRDDALQRDRSRARRR